jgi:chromosomal replication initiator protein
MAREAIRDLLPARPSRVSIDGIIRTVADHYSVKVSDLQSKKRTKSIAFPRQVCMFLARRLTSHSLEEIGGYFGGRDHTTVMYAFDKIRRQVKKDPALSHILERLTAEISS